MEVDGTALDDALWAALHELRLRGTVATAGDDPDTADDTTGAYDLLVQHGFAVRKRTVVAITATGRELHAGWARCAAGETEADLRVAYERFLPLNADLLRICHDWQVRPEGVANDHQDIEYDWVVIDRLRALHDRTSPVTRTMARAVERFAPYRTRLRHALERVEEGDADWLTSPRLDSYHTVWMLLHEDLLLALGLDRSSEDDVPVDLTR
jgi:hypothetical protein